MPKNKTKVKNTMKNQPLYEQVLKITYLLDIW